MFNCFNCGAKLPPNSLKCNACGFSPDINFMRVCPNAWNGGMCQITEGSCNFTGTYQECPIKNKAEKLSF